MNLTNNNEIFYNKVEKQLEASNTLIQKNQKILNLLVKNSEDFSTDIINQLKIQTADIKIFQEKLATELKINGTTFLNKSELLGTKINSAVGGLHIVEKYHTIYFIHVLY